MPWPQTLLKMCHRYATAISMNFLISPKISLRVIVMERVTGHNKLWRKRVLLKLILHAKFWIGKDPKYIWDHDSEPFDASKFVVTRFLEPFETGTGEEMYKEMSLDNVCQMIISKYERRRQSKKEKAAREAKAAAAARGE